MANVPYFEHTYLPQGHYSLDSMPATYADETQSYAMSSQPGAMITIPNPPKTTETKPRLGKDEVDVLEREFQKNPKPTTQTKRQFAESMGVDLARINNWFQNRRAKRKQERNQELYEAGQAQEALANSEPSSPDTFAQSNGYFGDNHLLTSRAASFAIAGPPQAVASYNPQYPDPSTASMQSLQRTMAAAHAANAQNTTEQEEYGFVVQKSALDASNVVLGHDFQNGDRVQFPSAAETFVSFDHGEPYPFAAGFVPELYSTGRSVSETHVSTDSTPFPTSTEYSSYHTHPGSNDVVLQLINTNFPSQMLNVHDGLPALSTDSGCSSQSPEDTSTPYCVGPDMHSMSPPNLMSMAFRSPPPMDIASRRKKVQHKPAALSAATINSRPPTGPRTVSHADNLRCNDSPCSSPMRRVISAGGSSRAVLSGRVQKTGIEAAQRSPINLGGFENAASFIEHNYQSFRSAPSMAGSSSMGSSLAPPTPRSPRERHMTLGKPDMARSSQSIASPESSPEDGPLSFVFNTSGSGAFTTVENDLVSPPETPLAQVPMQATLNNWQDGTEYHDNSWQFEVVDEPLYTPGLQDSFTMEIPMPPPYLSSSMSQPATPGLVPPFNPAFMFDHDSLQFKHETPYFTQHGGLEYTFPDTNPFPIDMSPTMTKHKTFQFSHTTAADFSEK